LGATHEGHHQVADPDALATYYGKNFRKNVLPATNDLESVSKVELANALAGATKETTKGAYHKIRHASALLGLVDAAIVRKQCVHCERLFAFLETEIGSD